MKNQESAINDLKQYAEHNAHALIISGSRGCGKTYLAKQYAKMLSANFVPIDPAVSNIREVINAYTVGSDKSVLCIENIDKGVQDASNTILKFAEEPPDSVFILVTCRDLTKVLSTVRSRCHTICVPKMTRSDLNDYAKAKDSTRYSFIYEKSSLWKAVESIADIDYLNNIEFDHIGELADIASHLRSKMSISQTMWKLQKFQNGAKIPVNLALRIIMNTVGIEKSVKIACIRAISDMDTVALPDHLILAKFLMDIRY